MEWGEDRAAAQQTQVSANLPFQGQREQEKKDGIVQGF